MATKSSGNLSPGASYTLGEYSFRLERSSISGSSNDKIEAICTKGGKNARKSMQILSTSELYGWQVDANDTEATVYAKFQKYSPTGGVSVSDSIVVNTQPGTNDGHGGTGTEINTVTINGSSVHMVGVMVGSDMYVVAISDNNSSFSMTYQGVTNGYTTDGPGTVSSHSSTYKGTQIRVAMWGPWYNPPPVPSIPVVTSSTPEVAGIVAIMSANGVKSVMVGRFSIDIEDAGGTGSDSDWDDPGDYDYDDYPDPDERDPDDPTTTLYLTVEGALSGRHNDPLNDTSYSYIPSDKATIKEYGCGGDGGNGGGGGAGAANVVVFKFGTSHADHKDITTIAKRHGYGSGGGKGGKGGDGCILIYY